MVLNTSLLLHDYLETLSSVVIPYKYINSSLGHWVNGNTEQVHQYRDKEFLVHLQLRWYCLSYFHFEVFVRLSQRGEQLFQVRGQVIYLGESGEFRGLLVAWLKNVSDKFLRLTHHHFLWFTKLFKNLLIKLEREIFKITRFFFLGAIFLFHVSKLLEVMLERQQHHVVHCVNLILDFLNVWYRWFVYFCQILELRKEQKIWVKLLA
jgi:hypothetical protein